MEGYLKSFLQNIDQGEQNLAAQRHEQGQHKQVFITEVGWCTKPVTVTDQNGHKTVICGEGSSPAWQAQNVAPTYDVFKEPQFSGRIGMAAWFKLRDGTSDDPWGLLNSSLQDKLPQDPHSAYKNFQDVTF